MEIKILGTGCPKCNQLEQAVNNVVKEMNLNATITKVTEIDKIIAYGIMRTPGLVIDEKVVLSGRVPSANELKELIQNNS